MVNIERVVRVLSERMCDKTPCIECAGFDLCVRKEGKANGLIKWFHEMKQEEGVVNAERIGLSFGYSRAIDAVRAIPPDDVVPVVHAKWIYHPNWELDGECAYQCPKCQMGSDVNYNYCMRCGAKMNNEWIYEGEE